MVEKDLTALRKQLNTIDSLTLNKEEVSRYYYYSGTLSFFEDNNQDAVNSLLKARKICKALALDNHLLFKINDKLIESIGATSEYSIRPKELIIENCKIAEISNDPYLVYDCKYYYFVEALGNKNYDKALSVLYDSYDILKREKIYDLIGNVESNLAHTYLISDRTDSVLPYLNKARKRYEAQNANDKLAYIYNNYGNYYKTIKKYDSALQYLNTAIKIPLSQEQASTKNFILKNIADTHYFKGDFKNAALAYEEYAKQSEVLDRAEHAKNIQYVNTKFATAEKEKENLELTIEKTRNQNIAIALATSLLLLSVIGLLIYRNTKRKQHIAEQAQELEIQKTEKILKEKEIETINAMVSGQEKERHRLAGELHDNLGSTLATVRMQVENLERNLDKVDNPKALLIKTHTLINEAYEKVRTISHERNAGVLAKDGLLPAIHRLAKTISSEDGLRIEVEDFGLEQRLSNDMEITIFRIVQELVTNIIKHAQASEATISLTQHDKELNILVEDNGKGFKVGTLQQKDGMGLGSIERRVEHLEGSMSVDSTPGRGTHIIIDIPL